jgi:hypothetical protein
MILGCAILVSAFLAPWWTRGFTYNFDEQDNPRSEVESGYEGVYYNYYPFRTPGFSGQGFSTDASRETATAMLGIGLLVCAAFVAAGLIVRWAMTTQRIEQDDTAPVYLAIGAFIAGLFTVLWGAFFLPLAGAGGGWLYGDEPGSPSGEGFGGNDGIESSRYANAGFFLGVVGAVGFPAYLWLDAARVRAASGETMTVQVGSTKLTF